MESSFTKNNRRETDISTFMNIEYLVVVHPIVSKSTILKSLCKMKIFVKIAMAAWVRKPSPVSQDKINQAVYFQEIGIA